MSKQISIDTTKETETRKDEHLKLALSSQNENIDSRFYYEPMLAAHPEKTTTWPTKLGNKTLHFPLWISSMTGGTAKTNEINLRLAKTAAKFGLGMGVGSARIALEDLSKRDGFRLRPILGKETPFYLNFGIAQIEKMVANQSLDQLEELVADVEADGVIIHVNPLQEWMQPEGDFIQHAAIDTIEKFLSNTSLPLIVKEVGQGYGPESMKRLLQLPLVAVEFAANGGTNFSKLELLRNRVKSEYMMPFVAVGHSAVEMLDFCNAATDELGNKVKCSTVIASGGIKNFLDGYYLLQKSKLNVFYGQASEFLRHAQVSQEELDRFVQQQIEGLLLAKAFLKIKE